MAYPQLTNIRGVIFDMDGTLVDSKLDFDAMRQEMGLTASRPILEQLADLPEETQRKHHAVLDRFETEGARNAILIDGALELLTFFSASKRPIALLTRNSQTAAHISLKKLGIFDHFTPLITRDDGPHKPDPWAILEICEAWELSADKVVMVGDHWLDAQTANNAGCRSILFGKDCGTADVTFQVDCLHKLLDAFRSVDSL